METLLWLNKNEYNFLTKNERFSRYKQRFHKSKYYEGSEKPYQPNLFLESYSLKVDIRAAIGAQGAKCNVARTEARTQKVI